MFAQFSVLFLISFVFPFICQAQSQKWAIQGGICTTLGTHQKNLGFTFRGYFLPTPFTQINGEITVLYHYKHYSKKKGIGFRTSIGALYGFGKTDISKRKFLSVINHQMSNEYALGYAFHYYGNNFQTSQNSGSLVAHLGNWVISLENDVLGGGGKDRFGTSALGITFQKEKFQYSLQNILWTGDTQGAMRVKDSLYPARFGYLDMEKQPLGKTSAGIISFKVNYAWNFGQTFQAGMGIDSEKIRNFLQNTLLHDMYFVPQSWIRSENSHVPMIDDHNEIYLYKPNQKIRPARFYGFVGVNQSGIYE
jgi:Bacterial toxin 23